MKINYILYTIILCISVSATVFLYKNSYKEKIFNNALNVELVKHFNLDKLAVDDFTITDDFTQWLSQKEQELWVEIKSAFGLTQQECDQRKKELAQDYNDSIANMKTKYGSGKQLDATTITYVHTIMKEFNVDAASIELVAWNQPLPASALDTIIFINERMLHALDAQTKKFIIGHELIHVIHKDHSTRYCLRNTTPIKPIADNSNNPLNKLCSFHELRADILCSIKGGHDYAQGAIQFAKDQRTKFGDFATHAYPTYSLRENIGIKIAGLVDKSLNLAVS